MERNRAVCIENAFGKASGAGGVAQADGIVFVPCHWSKRLSLRLQEGFVIIVIAAHRLSRNRRDDDTFRPKMSGDLFPQRQESVVNDNAAISCVRCNPGNLLRMQPEV